MRYRKSCWNPDTPPGSLGSIVLFGLGLAFFPARAAGACSAHVSGVAFTAEGSSVLVSSWTLDSPASETPVIVLANDASFTSIVSSAPGTLGQQGAAFNALSPASGYYLEVGISTESAYSCPAAHGSTLPGPSAALAAGAGASFTLQNAIGTAGVKIPPGAFSRPVTMAFDSPVAFPTAPSGAARLVPLNAGLVVGTLEGLEPSLPVTLTLSGSPPAAAGKDGSTFVIARYDDADRLWAPLPTASDPLAGTFTAQTTHFSSFQLMQSIPGSDLSNVKVFPNPFRPNQHQTAMSLTLLVPGAAVRIFNLLGEEVRELAADNTGTAVWDGRNAAGQTVGSGLYLAVIETGSQRKVVKLAVER